MKKLAILFISIILISNSLAQTYQWAKSMGGTADDYGYSISVDTSGNVYTTGAFQGTADFDPGAGTFNLTSAGDFDIFIQKLDASGNFLWAKSIGGTSTDWGYYISVGASGNVYTTGYFSVTVDFDPGAGTANLTSAGSSDIFIQKLDASGNFIWVKSMGGTSNDLGISISVDVSGNVYSTGYFQGTADFDPGAGTANLTSAGLKDIFTQKLDASGNFIWAKSMGGTSYDYGLSISVVASGNVYTTGYFSGTADFDPGAGTANLVSTGLQDIFIQKLDASGNFIWAKSLGGTFGDQGYSITVDASGNVYTTGYFSGTADFDPGAGTANLTSAGLKDIFTQKLDASGNFLWAKSMGGTYNDLGISISVDASGNVYTTGYFQGTADFDPGADTANLLSAGGDDIFFAKYDANGNYIWAKSIGYTNNSDDGKSIVIDASGNMFITGFFGNLVDFDPGPGTNYLFSNGSKDIFIGKYYDCSNNPPVEITSTTTNNVICFGWNDGSATVTVSGGSPPYIYVWNNTDTLSTGSATGLTAGIYNLVIYDTNNCYAVDTLTINEPPLLSGSIVEPDNFCVIPNTLTSVVSGGTPPYTYQWSNGQTSGTATGLAVGTYYVTITDNSGCTVSDTATIQAIPCDQWVQKANFGGTARREAVGFTISNKAYVGTGYDDVAPYRNDFWEFDLSTGTWTQKANFGGTERFGAVGFSIGSKGYVGTGFDGNSKSDFWEYDPGTDNWTQKSAFPGAGRDGAVGFSIGSKGYIGAGWDWFSLFYYNDFWEYDPGTDSWTQIADFGGMARWAAVGFSIGSKGYVGTGEDGTTYYNDFWEYDPSTDIWTQKTNFGGGVRSGAIGFAIGSNGYIGLGYNGGSYSSDFWEYESATNTWFQITNFSGTARNHAVGFSFDCKGYIGTGRDNNDYTSDFWEYTSCSQISSTKNLQSFEFPVSLKVYPNPNTGIFNIEINVTQTKNLQLKIVNVLAQEIYTEKLHRFKGIYEKQLDLNKYPAGIYNLQLISDEGTINKKIIIE